MAGSEPDPRESCRLCLPYQGNFDTTTKSAPRSRPRHRAHAVNADPKLAAFVRELKKREFEQ